MKKTFALFAVCAASLAICASAAETFVLFKAAATVPVTKVIPGFFDPVSNDFVDEVLVSKTLKGNDLVNLALGRKLGTKVDAKKEVLALAVATEGPGTVAAPLTRLVVYNPDPAVLADPDKIKATVLTLSSLHFDAALIAKKQAGQGIGKVTVTETPAVAPDPVGDSTRNKLFATSLSGSGSASATVSPTDASLTNFTFKLTSLAGPLHFKYTDAKNATPVEIDGIVIKAAFTTTGKPLAVLQLD